MRELERDLPSDTPACRRLTIIGRGRVGIALAAGLRSVPQPGSPHFAVTGPLGRGADGAGADAVLLCVPDTQIAAAAALVAPGPLVGHCSGATGLGVLTPHEGFLLHPLMTVAGPGTEFGGAGAAVDGTTDRALALARALADALGLSAVRVAEQDRPAYHAAASIASNFLVTLEATAERVAGTAGVDRALLIPLVRATVENWAALGPKRALTGPVARGDEATVQRQRAALAERTPDLLPLFDALVEATRALSETATETEPHAQARTQRQAAA